MNVVIDFHQSAGRPHPIRDPHSACMGSRLCGFLMSCVLNGGAPSPTSTALLFPCGESSAHVLSGKKTMGHGSWSVMV